MKGDCILNIIERQLDANKHIQSNRKILGPSISHRERKELKNKYLLEWFVHLFWDKRVIDQDFDHRCNEKCILLKSIVNLGSIPGTFGLWGCELSGKYHLCKGNTRSCKEVVSKFDGLDACIFSSITIGQSYTIESIDCVQTASKLGKNLQDVYDETVNDYEEIIDVDYGYEPSENIDKGTNRSTRTRTRTRSYIDKEDDVNEEENGVALFKEMMEIYTDTGGHIPVNNERVQNMDISPLATKKKVPIWYKFFTFDIPDPEWHEDPIYQDSDLNGIKHGASHKFFTEKNYELNTATGQIS
jgi:hypothetical protein